MDFRTFLKIGSNDFSHTSLICSPTYAMRAGMRKLAVKIYNKLQLGLEYVQFGHFSPKWPKNAHFQASEGQFPARNW